MFLRPLALIFLLAVFHNSAIAVTTGDPPSKNDLLGEWVGFDENALHFFRLKLQTNECWLATTYPKSPIRVFKPAPWTVTNGKLGFKARSEGFDLEVQGQAEWNRIVLKMKQDNGTWSETITFYREEAIAKRLREIHNQMEATLQSGSRTITQAQAKTLALEAFRKTGLKHDHYRIQESSDGKAWDVWFDRNPPRPGSSHSVRVDKLTGRTVFFQGE